MSAEPLPTDSRFHSREHQYTLCNFHSQDRLEQAKALIADDTQPSVLVLSGKPGVGRSYFLAAAVYQLNQEGQRTRLVTLDLDGYEAESQNLTRFVNHQLAKQVPDDPDHTRWVIDTLQQSVSPTSVSLLNQPLLSVVLPLKWLLTQFIALIGEAEEPAGPARRDRDTLLRLLKLLVEDRCCVVHVADYAHLNAIHREWLLDSARQLPRLKLAFSCEPDVPTEAVTALPGGAFSAPVLRLEFAPLTQADCQARLAERFQPNDLPNTLADALWRASGGLPQYLALKLSDLTDAGVLYRDTQHVWRLADPGLTAEACVAQFTTDLYEPIEQALKSLVPPLAERLAAFLNSAALCGDAIPADLVLEQSGLAGEEKDLVIDAIDNHLAGVEPTAVLRDYAYGHPSFPDHLVYGFANPLYRGVLLTRLPPAHQKRLASDLLTFLKPRLPVRHRGVAALYLTLARYLEDPEQRAAYASELAWWVGTDEATALTRYLAQAIRQGQIAAAVVWAVVRLTENQWPPYRRLAVLDALQESGQVPVDQLGDFYADRGWLLYQTGRYPEALVDGLAGLKFCDEQSLLAGSLNNTVGFVKSAIGGYDDALPYLKKALGIVEQALGPDHPHVAATLNNLALLYGAQGKYAEAEPLYQRALKIREQAQGPNHPDVAANLNNLALLYGAQGKYAEAEPWYQRALGIVEQALGPDHPHVAATLNNLALLYGAQGKYAEAEPWYQRALGIEERALGPDHPDVATTLNNLARLYQAQGKYAEAEPLYQRALAIREQALGAEHPTVITVRKNYADLLKGMGRTEEAVALENRAKAIQ